MYLRIKLLTECVNHVLTSLSLPFLCCHVGEVEGGLVNKY